MPEQTDPSARKRRRWSPRGDRGLKARWPHRGDRGLKARWPLFFLLALATVSLLLHAAKYRRGDEIAKLQRQYAVLVQARPIAETKARRSRFYQIRYFLGYPMAASYAVADLVRRVAAITPPLRLAAIQVDPGLQGLGFELTVEVSGGRPREVRRRLDAFLGRLRLVPDITAVALSGPGPTARGGGVRVYTVGGRAELQL
jgi:hypothetical protein